MASNTLKRMETAVSHVVAKPAPRVVAELREVAAGDPRNPAPHLAMAVVSGFAHHNLNECKKHLEDAKRLLREGAGHPHDAEWQYSEGLAQFIEHEIVLFEAKRRGGPAAAEQLRRAVVGSRAAMARMESLQSKIGDSDLVKTLQVASMVHSRTLGTRSPQYRQGMARLRAINGSNAPVKDLAGLFLMYGYRRARNHTRAIEIGKVLEQRNPHAALPKVMLGSVYAAARKYDRAAASLEEAVAIAPNDPHLTLAYARVLRTQGKLTEAKAMLEKTGELDAGGELTPFADLVRLNLDLHD